VAMVDDDRFIIETANHWYFGEDNSGNILDSDNIRGLWNRLKVSVSSNGVHLVTGDGSVDTSSDPNEQESIVSELHYAEAICALGALARGGSLVLKMFNLFECETICLLYVLAVHFEEVSVFKPACSKAPNGETYVVALNFRGIDADVLESLLAFVSSTFPAGKSLLPLESIPSSFLDELISIAGYFTQKQIDAIERNLELEKRWNRQLDQGIRQLNDRVVDEFRKRCFISSRYQQGVRIVQNVWLDGSATSLGNSMAGAKGGPKQRGGGTLRDRQGRKRDHDSFLSGGKDAAHESRDDEEPPAKQQKASEPSASCRGESLSAAEIHRTEESIAMRWMKKSGYTEGKGLGLHEQGRATPIQTSSQHQRFGLGHHQRSMNETMQSTVSKIPSVFDEPFFTEYGEPLCSSSSSHRSSILDLDTVTVGRNLTAILSSIFVRFEHLETLYKKREEYRNGTRTSMDGPQSPRIFLSDQLEELMRDEAHCQLHGRYIDYNSAYQLASLDVIFKLVSTSVEIMKSEMHLHVNRLDLDASHRCITTVVLRG
jgi:hypothetical protein